MISKMAEKIFSQRYFTKQRRLMTLNDDFLKGMFTMSVMLKCEGCGPSWCGSVD